MEFWESIPFNSEIDSEDIPVVELESDHVDGSLFADVKKILSVSRCKILAEKQDFDSRVSKMTNDQTGLCFREIRWTSFGFCEWSWGDRKIIFVAFFNDENG